MKQSYPFSKKRRIKRGGFTLVELITVMVLIGIVGSVSGVFLAPMAKSYISGRNMVRTAGTSRFAFDRLNQLMTRTVGPTVVAAGKMINFRVQTDGKTTQAMQLSYEAGTGRLLLNGEPLLKDLADYSVVYTNGVILNRFVFKAAPGTPVDLILHPRNY